MIRTRRQGEHAVGDHSGRESFTGTRGQNHECSALASLKGFLGARNGFVLTRSQAVPEEMRQTVKLAEAELLGQIPRARKALDCPIVGVRPRWSLKAISLPLERQSKRSNNVQAGYHG